MIDEKLKQQMIELLDELYKREKIVSFEQIAETFIVNGVTIRERGERGEWQKVYQNEQATVYECSKCHHLSLGTSDYCICGADMRGG